MPKVGSTRLSSADPPTRPPSGADRGRFTRWVRMGPPGYAPRSVDTTARSAGSMDEPFLHINAIVRCADGPASART